jgi:hypothetical protein
MERLEAAAKLMAADMSQTLESEIAAYNAKSGPITRGPKPGRPSYDERYPGSMVKTIRVRRLFNDVYGMGVQVGHRNVWIMAGNYNTWWAIQLEYGRGGWNGGAKPFIRPIMRRADSYMKAVL